MTDELDALILGGDPEYAPADLARLLDVPVDEVQRIWRSLGFAELEPGTVAFTETDAMAFAMIRSLLAAGGVEVAGAVSLLRGVGQTMARLADWDVAAAISPKQRDDESAVEYAERRVALARQQFLDFGPAFEELLVYAWRRHLAAALARTGVHPPGADESDDPDDTAHVTVGFADLVGFTALSNELGEDRIADLVEIFEARSHDVVAGAGGRVIKSLGDSVLFVALDAAAAMTIADGIVQVIGRDKRMPDVRIGVASGPVSMRMGDVFGPAVNMAARLTSVARRNRVIIDQATADLLPDDGFDLRRLPARPLRGFGDVEPIAVRRI